MTHWLLPEGICDVLPFEAQHIEDLRRAFLDLYRSYGYELVMPPLVEYLDSLLTGVGAELDLRTFKFVDQLSGRMLGARADMTAQAARIDAHILNRSTVTRLCYAGTVLHTRPAHALAVREPLQVGAELFGSSALAADFEIQTLALASLRAAGLAQLHIDFGHTGIVRTVLSPVPSLLFEPLAAALTSKDSATLEVLAKQLDADVREHLLALARLYGGQEVLTEARRQFKAIPSIGAALDELEQMAQRCEADHIGFDLARLDGYQYYTGANFAVYGPGSAGALLRGGRYDHVGKAFGRQRPATGFSTDLRELVAAKHLERVDEPQRERIVAPAVQDPALDAMVSQLRQQGKVVIADLGGQAHAALGTHRLECSGGSWRVVAQHQKD